MHEPVWQDNTELQESEIEIIVDYIFSTCDFPYKALAAIINLRNEHKGLLTNVDIHEIYVYIGESIVMPDYFLNKTGGDAAC